MDKLKVSHISEAGETVVAIGNLAPPFAASYFSRIAIHSMHRFGQRSLNTVTTNVPGPKFPLYCLGHEMLEYLPFAPISHGLRVGTAILSYNGNVFFGVTGDYGDRARGQGGCNNSGIRYQRTEGPSAPATRRARPMIC